MGRALPRGGGGGVPGRPPAGRDQPRRGLRCLPAPQPCASHAADMPPSVASVRATCPRRYAHEVDGHRPRTYEGDDMPRSMWRGAIQFGLVTIPVKLYLATEPRGGLSFNLLHEDDLQRIQMKVHCPEHGE